MTAQQAFQLTLTVLFVAVLIQLFIALTLFHWRMWRDERQRRARERLLQQQKANHPDENSTGGLHG